MNTARKFVGAFGLVMGFTVACGGSSDSDPSGGAGSGGVGGSAGSAALSWQECFGDDGQRVQWALNLCSGASCGIAEHVIDCCGTVKLVGVDQSNLKQFEACEAAWRQTLPDCQCAAGPLQVQQPNITVSSASEAQANCINWSSEGGVCMTTPK